MQEGNLENVEVVSIYGN